jgi:hypothetical protein
MTLRLAIALLVAAGCGSNDPDPDARATDAPAIDGALVDAGALVLGEPCAGDGECFSGACTDLLGQAAETHCSAACDAVDTACPEDGVCLVPGDFAGVCVRPCTPTGPACPATLDCQLVDGVTSGCF